MIIFVEIVRKLMFTNVYIRIKRYVYKRFKKRNQMVSFYILMR